MDLKSLISKIEQLSEAADYEASISKREKSADFSTKPQEKRGKKVSGKRYGAQDDDDRDDDDEDKKSEKKSEEPKVKRGRGRPKKHSDAETGEVPKYSFGKELQSFMIGNLPGGKLPGKPGKKHKLKDWMEHVEGNMLAEDADLNVNIVKSKPTQPTSTLTVNNEPMISATSNDPKAQQTLQSLQAAMKSGELQINPDALSEEELEEVAAPGQEEWIKDNKQRFIDQYGKKKGMSVLYATAWKRSKSMKESVEPIMEGYTLEDILESFPHEHKQCQEGWGMDESLYEALCEYYFKQGRIPRKVWHGSLDELRHHVEECYMEDTGDAREVLEAGFQTANPGDAHMSPLANEDEQLDEVLPALAGVGGALARGAAFGAGSALADKMVDEDEGFTGPDLMDEDLDSDLDVLDDGGEIDSTPELEDELYLDDEMMEAEDADTEIQRMLAKSAAQRELARPAYARKPISLAKLRAAGEFPEPTKPMSHAEKSDIRIKTPAVQRTPISMADLRAASDRTMSSSQGLASRARELGLDESKITKSRKQGVAEGSKTNNHKESKMKDAQMESWDRQLKALLKEGLTITTSTGQPGGSDSVSVNATDADAQKLMKMLQNAGIHGGIGGSMGMQDTEGTPGIAIDVEPMAQDEVLGQLHGADDGGDDTLGFLKRMIGARTGDMEMQHGDYEQEQGHDHEHDHDQEGKVVMVGEEEVDEMFQYPTKKSGGRPDELARRQRELGPNAMLKYGDEYKTIRKGETPIAQDMKTAHSIAGPKSKLPEEDMGEGNEFTKARLNAIKHGKSSFTVGGKTYKVTGDTSDEKKQVGEEKETCNECGAMMETNHKCNETANDDPATMEARKHKHGDQLDEWANSPAGKSEDEEFTTELDYMTKLIAGGLNGPKRDQTTLPHTQVKTELGGNADISAMMRKLAGIR